jgi:predicted O-linked N-acetylglucosamine transferase (SPINDLY family)
MEVLNALPESVLWLLKPGQTAEQNLRRNAAEHGVNPERLIFTARESLPIEREAERIGRYLASYKLADLFLDTWPYNAGTTAIDALWAGLPVLTKSGQSVVSRMATSALSAIEMPELITHSANDYRQLAIELATDANKLDLIKAKLRANRLTTGLFDSEKNTRHIESAYLEMHRKYINGQEPSHFSIAM